MKRTSLQVLAARAIALEALIVGSVPAYAGKYTQTVGEDSTTGFRYTGTHKAVDYGAAHICTAGTNWRLKLTINEVNGFLEHDSLTLDGSVVHVKPPHGEGENEKSLLIAGTCSAGAGRGADISFLFPQTVEHKDHGDAMFLDVSMKIDYGIALNDIDSYVVAITAWHDTKHMKVTPGGCIGCLSPGTVIPPSPSEAFGSCRVFPASDLSSMSFRADLAGLSPWDVTSVKVHEGMPGQNGPVIMDIGSFGHWAPVEDEGAAFCSQDMPLFPHVWSAIQKGRAYVQVCTVQHPEGDVRAQLVIQKVDTPIRAHR